MRGPSSSLEKLVCTGGAKAVPSQPQIFGVVCPIPALLRRGGERPLASRGVSSLTMLCLLRPTRLHCRVQRGAEPCRSTADDAEVLEDGRHHLALARHTQTTSTSQQIDRPKSTEATASHRLKPFCAAASLRCYARNSQNTNKNASCLNCLGGLLVVVIWYIPPWNNHLDLQGSSFVTEEVPAES